MNKSKLTKMLAIACVMGITLTACGGGQKQAQQPAEQPQEEKTVVYAVEAGSAGEAVAQELGMEYNAV